MNVIDSVVRYVGVSKRELLEKLEPRHYRAFHDKRRVTLGWLKYATRRLFKEVQDRRLKERFRKLLNDKSLVKLRRRQHQDILLELTSLWLREKQPEDKDKGQGKKTKGIIIRAKTWFGELFTLDLEIMDF